MCQLDWAMRCLGCWLNVISGCVCEGLWKRLAFENCTLNKEGLFSPVWVGITQFADVPNKAKRQRKDESLFSWAGTSIFCPQPSELVLSDFGTYPSSSPVLGLRTLNSTTSVPSSPVFRQYIMELLSLHNDVNQFPYTKSLTYLYVSYKFCFSREAWLLQKGSKSHNKRLRRTWHCSLNAEKSCQRKDKSWYEKGKLCMNFIYQSRSCCFHGQRQ